MCTAQANMYARNMPGGQVFYPLASHDPSPLQVRQWSDCLMDLTLLWQEEA